MGDQMDNLDIILQSMGHKPAEYKEQTDASGNLLATDPVFTSTPQPPPAPHPIPELPASMKTPSSPKLKKSAPATPPPAPAQPVELSSITSNSVKEVKQPDPEPVPRVEDKMIFFTGLSGVGKTWLWGQLEEKWPDRFVIVDSCESNRDFSALQKAGFVHYHVMAQRVTIESRQRRLVGLTFEEKLAQALDSNVRLQVMKGGTNHKLHCVWCDSPRTILSPRLLTLDEFFQQYRTE